MKIEKYRLYELSVQSPQVHAKWFAEIFKEIVGREARDLREDFCGTFRDSIEWIKLHPQNTALGLDLDPEPLKYGQTHHLKKLKAQQKKRIKLAQKDVLYPTTPQKDLIIACNFSFYIFKERKILKQYFKSSLQSLRKNGALILEMAGGPGMISPLREQKSVALGKNKKFTYIWQQRSFDPITHDARYSIHFKLSNGQKINNAFNYDWRLWTIPEVKDLLEEAGFRKVSVLWESSHKGEGTGEYVVSEKGDNAFAWIAYVVGTT